MQRRKRVMQRSMKLGHCVCDPKQPCPCDLFKAKNICLCAGERMESPTGPVALTQLVEKAGCASKIDQAFLKSVLKDLPEHDDPRVLIGAAAGDDAGVYELPDGTCLVQTVDIFTPSVDDPYLFGQVAAANSVSDVYAMGGTPLTALSVIGFPVRKIPDAAMTEILRGGIDKMREAGVAVIGGHSINDPEIKAGFAVTGVIDKRRIFTNAAARPGDALILTKPLGTGIVAFAAQIRRATPQSTNAAAASMTQLNKTAAGLMLQFNAHACTDVTGFSLIGHLSEMALRSHVDVELCWDRIPFLPGVPEYAVAGILPGGIERNKESCGHALTRDPDVTERMEDILFDPQTSGGLLIAVAQDKADALLTALHDAGIPCAAVIGAITGPGSGRIRLTTDHTRPMPQPESGSVGWALAHQDSPNITQAPESPASQDCCCPPTTAIDAPPAGTEAIFRQFLSTVGRPGGLDAVTKQAVNIALCVLSRCEPCLETHLKKAKKMGFSQAEIDEAAWLGIAFGGSPAMMFYKQLSEKVNAKG